MTCKSCDCEDCVRKRAWAAKVGDYWLTEVGRAEIRETWTDREDGNAVRPLLDALDETEGWLQVLRRRCEQAETQLDAAVAAVAGLEAVLEAAKDCEICDAVHEVLWHESRRGTGVELALATVAALSAAEAQIAHKQELLEASADIADFLAAVARADAAEAQLADARKVVDELTEACVRKDKFLKRAPWPLMTAHEVSEEVGKR